MKTGILAPAALAALMLAAAPAMAAELVMSNRTPDRLTLFVNGQQSCAAGPGQDCSAQVNKGVINLRATAPNGLSIYDRLTIRDATTLWTVEYYQPTSSGPGEAPPQ